MGHKVLAEVVHRMEENGVFYKGLLNSLGMEAGSEERLQQVVCYKTKDEIQELDLKE